MTTEFLILLIWLACVTILTGGAWIGYVLLAQRVTALEAIRRKSRKKVVAS